MKTKLVITINISENTAYEDVAHVLTSLAATFCDPDVRDERPAFETGFVESIEGRAGGTVGNYRVE